jgi:restriction endonuclease S subunit
MQNLLEALSCDKLNLSEISRQPKERFKPDADKYYSYIEISDITGNGRAESSTIKGADAPSRAKWVVKPGDLITSTVRPVRRLSAIISEEQEGFICSSGFEVLRPKNISAEVLLVYLRLPLICELLDLHTTASMYPTISPTDLLQIPISLPDEDSQIKIKKLVQKSFDTRVKSVMMTESAKTLVEKAISGKVY